MCVWESKWERERKEEKEKKADNLKQFTKIHVILDIRHKLGSNTMTVKGCPFIFNSVKLGISISSQPLFNEIDESLLNFSVQVYISIYSLLLFVCFHTENS